MPLRDLLSARRIALLDHAPDRAAVLDAAARLLASDDAPEPAGPVPADIAAALRARETLASTGIGRGVAIPHGRLEGLEQSRAAFLRLATPVDFGAADGEPVDLVVAMGVPQHSVQDHLHQLADVAERFADPGFRDRLRAAPDLDALLVLLLTDAEPRP